jgi:hypothetical protein
MMANLVMLKVDKDNNSKKKMHKTTFYKEEGSNAIHFAFLIDI